MIIIQDSISGWPDFSEYSYKSYESCTMRVLYGTFILYTCPAIRCIFQLFLFDNSLGLLFKNERGGNFCKKNTVLWQGAPAAFIRIICMHRLKIVELLEKRTNKTNCFETASHWGDTFEKYFEAFVTMVKKKTGGSRFIDIKLIGLSISFPNVLFDWIDKLKLKCYYHCVGWCKIDVQQCGIFR